GFLIIVIGCLAVASPFFAGTLALFLGGLLLIVCGVLEMLETFYAGDSSSRSSYLSGLLSILAGILFLNMPELTLNGVAILLGISFLIDGISSVISSIRAKFSRTPWIWMLAAGLINVTLGVMLITRWPLSGWAFTEILVGVRMLTAGWSMLLGRPAPAHDLATPPDMHPDLRLGLSPDPAFATLNASLKAKEDARRPVDAYWCWIFVI